MKPLNGMYHNLQEAVGCCLCFNEAGCISISWQIATWSKLCSKHLHLETVLPCPWTSMSLNEVNHCPSKPPGTPGLRSASASVKGAQNSRSQGCPPVLPESAAGTLADICAATFGLRSQPAPRASPAQARLGAVPAF